MKIVVFGSDHRLGVWEDDRVIDLNVADAQLPSKLLPFIELGDAGIKAAALVVGRLRGTPADGSMIFNVADVKLQAPWPGKRIACAGGNYAEHSYGMALNSGDTSTTLEKTFERIRTSGNWGFWKVLDEVAGDGDEIEYPDGVNYFDYEGEVAIVIGKRGKNIPAAQLKDYVWGVTLANDWSNRDNLGPARAMSFNINKNFDRSASLGPCIVVGDIDPQNVDCQTRVNGDLRQNFDSKDMVFSFAETLEFLSHNFTFVPGDVLLGGTGAGTAQDSTKLNADKTRPKDRYLKKGDVVEISSKLVGTISNKIN